MLLIFSGAKDKCGNIGGFALKFSHLQKITAPTPWGSGSQVWPFEKALTEEIMPTKSLGIP